MTTVEGTNDYSIVSKLSAASAGYFEDPFLQEFVEKKRRRAGLINWGYYIRYKSLECSFETIVKNLCQKNNRKFQILSIGAGFDTTYFNVKSKNKTENFVFFEVDLPSNVARKSKLIERSEICRKQLKAPKFSEDGIVDDNFVLFACDLADQVRLDARLSKFGFDFSLPTVILSECVITYMQEKDSTSLIKFLASKLAHASFIVYEQIRPSDAFGQFMVEHFKNIGSPIKGVHKYSSTRAHEMRYRDSGWRHSTSKTLTDVFHSLDKEEVERIRNLEPFDEYEEFFLKMSHYLVVCASNGDLVNLSPFQNYETKLTPITEPSIIAKEASFGELNRFGHSSAHLGGRVFVFGGFGVLDKLHRRLPQMLTLDLSSSGPMETTEGVIFRRVYSSTAVDQVRQRVYLSGGRASPDESLEDIVEVDVATGQWRRADWRLGTGRWRHCSAVLADHLLILGGLGGGHTVLGLHLETGQWLPPVQVAAEVVSASCDVWGDAGLLVWSGGLENMSPSSAVRTVSIKNKQMSIVKLGVEISPRFSHSSHVMADKLVVCGGVGPGAPPPCEIIDLVTGVRQLVSLPTSLTTGGLLMYHSHSSVARESTIIILGGGGNCFSFGTHYNKCVQFDLSGHLR